jgi:GT2 family glycosyltransferase/glycosyltransferase involved in cell wall biosynthesis
MKDQQTPLPPHAILAEEISRRDQAEKRIVLLERYLAQAVHGLKSYEHLLDRELSELQSQRAWRIMLLIRKIYWDLTKGSSRRKLDSLMLPFRSKTIAEALNEFEPRLPQIRQFIPPQIWDFERDWSSLLLSDSEILPHQTNKPDLIVLPIFDYEFRMQRPQHVASEFARAGHRVFWVSLTRSIANPAMPDFEMFPIAENLWELRLRGEGFDLYTGRLEGSALEARQHSLRRFLQTAAIGESFALVQFPSWRPLAQTLHNEFGIPVIYDLMDDWANWPAEPKPGRFALESQEALLQEAELVTVTAKDLAERYGTSARRLSLVPNGASFEQFQNAAPNSELDSLPRPIVGYYGALAAWVDSDLIRELAQARPNYSFVLIGDVSDPSMERLAKLPNVSMLGEKKFSELPGYLTQFDACLVPFRVNTLTHAVDPVKIYEYLSQGKPVVATRMKELEPLADLIYLAGSSAEAIHQLDRAVSERDDVLKARRVEFAARNTWRNRYDTLVSAANTTPPLVSVLIVTYNSAEYIAPLTRSLRDWTAYPNLEIVIVDNASSDSTPQLLHEYAATDPRVRLLLQNKNLGFAGGNNLAASASTGDFLILLNADTIVTPGWISRLLRPFFQAPGIGMSAPVTNWSGNQTKIDAQYHDRPSLREFARMRSIEYFGQICDLDVVPLLCAAISRALWNDLGGLDEQFAIGMFEDDDFCRRVRKQSHRIVTAEDCFIHHFGNGAFRKLKDEFRNEIWETNRKRFEAKWPDQPWKEHRIRPGVRALHLEPVFKPEDFDEIAPQSRTASG